jgi:hypothetical protein
MHDDIFMSSVAAHFSSYTNFPHPTEETHEKVCDKERIANKKLRPPYRRLGLTETPAWRSIQTNACAGEVQLEISVSVTPFLVMT